MSHIERALQKATEQRAKEGSPQAPEREAVVNPTYTTTRSLQVDEALLLQNRLVTVSANAAVVEQYNILKTRILQRTREQGLNTIMVTSTGPGEGKTLTAINLAISIARELTQTVLLIDADLRAPAVNRHFGFEADAGLSDYLFRDQLLAELLINPGIAKLTILPAGRPVGNSVEYLGSPKMRALVEEMKARYPDRYLIFDCPPLLTHADPLIFSDYVDGVLLVVEAGKTPERDIRKAVELLSGRLVLGCVLNNAALPAKGYASYGSA